MKNHTLLSFLLVFTVFSTSAYAQQRQQQGQRQQLQIKSGQYTADQFAGGFFDSTANSNRKTIVREDGIEVTNQLDREVESLAGEENSANQPLNEDRFDIPK